MVFRLHSQTHHVSFFLILVSGFCFRQLSLAPQNPVTPRRPQGVGDYCLAVLTLYRVSMVRQPHFNETPDLL